jgi:hypothetical protein
MTDQQSHPTTFGSIHDYLKRVNGETADLGIPWRSKEQPKVERDNVPATKSGTTALKTTGKESMQESENEINDETTSPDKDQTLSIQEQSPTPAPRDEGRKTTPKRKKPVTEPLSRQTEKPKTTGDFEQMVENFDYTKESGKRHQLFIPDDVYNALLLTYGERKISAFYCALARRYIAMHKEDMRQRITSRTNLLSDNTSPTTT